MKIKDINGAGEIACKCESWLDHWARFSGQSPSYCPVAECMNTIQTGATAQKEDPADRGWYIIPLCQKHNAMQGASLTVNDHFELVSVKARETCGENEREARE